MTRRPRTSLRTAAPRTARPRLAGTYIFVGPTLAAPEVVALLPTARVLPPASVGDVLALARRRGVKRIAIIDGYFERMAAVWHKEILVALERGIEVYGAEQADPPRFFKFRDPDGVEVDVATPERGWKF